MNAVYLRFLLFWLVVAVLNGPGQAQTVAQAVNLPGKNFRPGTTAAGLTPWIVDNVIRHDGVQSARSGAIDRNQDSSIFTDVTGPGTLTFWWKVSSEEVFDKLVFLLNGNVVQEISGEQNWAPVTLALPAGGHTLEWRYAKDGNGIGGSDAGWVDEILFVPQDGDPGKHVDAVVRTASVSSTSLVFSDPPNSKFRAVAVIDLHRLDEPGSPPVVENVPVNLSWEIWDISGRSLPVPLPDEAVDGGDHLFMAALATHGGSPTPRPATAVLQETFDVGVSAPLNINPGKNYELRLRVRLFTGTADEVLGGGSVSGPIRLMSFSGKLLAGTMEAGFDQITFSPASIAAVAGGNYSVTVTTPPDRAWLAGNPAVRFRLDQVNANYDPLTGHLSLQGANVVPVSDFAHRLNGVRLKAKNVTLNAAGLRAGELRVVFPAGFSVMAATPEYLLEKTGSGFAVMENVALGPDFSPPDPLPLTPLAVRRGVVPDAVQADVGNLFYCAHERLPCWFLANSLVYHPGTGRFTTATPFDAPWLHVRAVEKVAMDSITPAPGQPKDFRPANDSYFSRTWALGAPATSSFSITANPQGIALLNAECPLGPATHAPHWPQGVSPDPKNTQGFTFTGGTVTFADNELVPGASGLTGVARVVQNHARDPVDTGKCVNRANEGTFDFLPGGQQLALTADGGLLAAGTLAAPTPALPQNLAWGTVDKQGPGGTPALPTPRSNPSAVALFISRDTSSRGTSAPAATMIVPAPSCSPGAAIRAPP